MEGDKHLLESKVKEGFNLSVSKVITDSFNLFGKGAGSYIALTLLSAIILFLIGSSYVISIEVLIVVGVFAAILLGPLLQVGVARFSKHLAETGESDFKLFFSGVNYNLSQLIIQSAVVLVINAAVSILPDFAYYTDYFSMLKMGFEDPESFFDLLMEFNEAHSNRGMLSFFVSIFSFYISLGLSLTPYIVSFYNVTAFTAMDISFRTINKVVFRAAALNIVLSILMVLGFVFLLIGSLATVPIFLIGSYLLFKYTIGEKNGSGATNVNIDDHLID